MILPLLLLLAQAADPVGPPAPPGLIDELVANASLYRTTIPSLTADETVETEGSYLSLFHQRTKASGTFRALRTTPNGSLEESRQIAVYDGKPVPPGKKVAPPMVLFGGFGRFQEMFFSPSHRVCFDFTMLPQPGPGGTLQIQVSGRPGLDPASGCPVFFAQIRGAVTVDAATHQIVHFERTVPDNIANETKLAQFASVDCAPAKVGDQTYWLPTVVIGHMHNGPIRGTFTAHYSNYHRYAASMTVLPDITEVPPAAPPPQ